MSVHGAAVHLVGEPVCGAEFLKGYNTYWDPETESVTAAACGAVEVVERVVSVRGLHPRYQAEVGDVVVARVIEVSGNRWKLSIGSQTDAMMLLSNVTEPGGVLRRRGREDELTMRNIFTEGDVVVAEVQRLMADGTVSLHTRSAEKFGKMSGNGQLTNVNPSLIRRVRSHFHVFLRYGVSMVLGMNGGVWISAATPQQLEAATLEEGAVHSDSEGEDGERTAGAGGEEGAAGLAQKAQALLEDPVRVRQYCARFRNCLITMSQQRLPIDTMTVQAAVAATLKASLTTPSLLTSVEAVACITEAVETVRTQRKRPRRDG